MPRPGPPRWRPRGRACLSAGYLARHLTAAKHPLPKTALLFAALLSLALASAQGAPAGVAGDPLRIEVSGDQRDVVKLVDAVTGAVVAIDRLGGQPVRGSQVSADNAAVAVRHGAGGDGDAVAVYAITWRVDPSSGAKVGDVAQVLVYAPRDGYLGVSLRPVPAGTVVRVQSGRHVPLWNKVFLLERGRGRWLAWPRALAPDDATEGVPGTVPDTDSGAAYGAWVRPLAH